MFMVSSLTPPDSRIGRRVRLRDLHILFAVVQHGSMAKAGLHLGISQSAVSQAVRALEQRSDRPSDDRYGTSIRVKTNVADVLRRELARTTWQHEQVTVGAATDPYQPAEGKYKLTRACLEVFRDAANPFGIITRGPMIVRDIDVLARAAKRADVTVTFSVPTIDREIWRRTEPGTAPPEQRLRAVRELTTSSVCSAASSQQARRAATAARRSTSASAAPAATDRSSAFTRTSRSRSRTPAIRRTATS